MPSTKKETRRRRTSSVEPERRKARKTRRKKSSKAKVEPTVSQAVEKIEQLPAEKQASIGRKILAGAGSLVGEYFGGPLGAIAGRDFANGFSDIIGLGDYTVRENVLLHEDPLRVHNKSHSGETVVRHREYLGDVISSATAGKFEIATYAINPGVEQTFPWLAQLAVNFEQYRIEGMLFEFRSMSGDAITSVNTALGSVIMATQYNAANPPFSNKSEMENYEFGTSCKPSATMIHPIECARMQTTIDELYTRSSAVPYGQDPRLYDIGKFSIATVGCQGTSVNLGELWITYQVALLKPKLYTTLGNYISVLQFSAANYTNALPLGTTSQSILYNSFPSANIVFTGDNFTLPMSSVEQAYIVEIWWAGTATVGAYALPTVSANGCLINALSGPSISAYFSTGTSPDPAVDTNISVCGGRWNLRTLANQLAVFGVNNNGVLPTAGAVVQLSIYQVPLNAIA